ncbi:hypothetical protein A4A49_46850, partial [Nicotiana attenuata]
MDAVIRQIVDEIKQDIMEAFELKIDEVIEKYDKELKEINNKLDTLVMYARFDNLADEDARPSGSDNDDDDDDDDGMDDEFFCFVYLLEVETSCGSIATTQKLCDDAHLNEGKVEKTLSENTAMVVDVDSELNDAGNADIEKGMQPGESTAEDKREELLEAGRKEFGEILKQYEKGEIHIFTPVESQTGSVGMKTPSVSQHLDQISSDASELFQNLREGRFLVLLCVIPVISPTSIYVHFHLVVSQGADSEGNSAGVGVREETEERREQQGVDQAVVPHPAAVQ